MELPFKYIVLSIIRILNERNMPLVIEKTKLVNYLIRFVNESYFTIEERKKIIDDFDFDYEMNSLLSKYFQYFDNEENQISFDSSFTSEIDDLILDEMEEVDDLFINDIDALIEKDTGFLDILGVKINKELYNYLLDIEKELENCYNELCRLDDYAGIAKVNTSSIINEIKKLKIKKTVMLLNASNLLSDIEQRDLMQYACNISDKVNEFEVVELLLDDYGFNKNKIIDDIFLRSIFIEGDSYVSNLGESININYFGIMRNKKYSTIKFYLTFLELLEKEIENAEDFLYSEVFKIKYRLINTLDSVYGTGLFTGKYEMCDSEFKEDYIFILKAVSYFIKELLMYDDDQYMNKESNADNKIIYLNNIMKKLLIETYYKLTNDIKIVDMIKENKLYGVNTISTNFLKEIVDKPKTKIKEV